MLLLALLLLLFGAGIRFDRAFLMDNPQAKGPSSAFAALVPPPVVLAGDTASGRATGARRGRGLVDRPAGGNGAPGTGTDPLLPTNPVVVGDAPADTVTGPAATQPVTIAAAAPNGQFGSGGRSLFGIPSGVIFGGGGGTVTPPVNPGTPGAVPEPDTWMLMILGIGMIGMALRARGSAVRRREQDLEAVTA